MSEEKLDCRDTAIFVGPDVAIIHDENHEAHIGTCAPIAEGQPVPPGALLIESEEGKPYGRVIWRSPSGENKHDGPSRVSTRAYRSGWDRTFGREAN